MNEYCQYKIASYLARFLPEKLAYWVGLRVADQFFRRNHKGREAMAENFRKIFTWRGLVPAEKTIGGHVRKTFQHFGKYLVDFFRFSRLSDEEVKQIISFEHKDYLEQAHAHGKGVLLVTAHFGNWELGSAVIAALGYKVNAVYLPQRMQKLNALFDAQRQKRGVNLIPLGNSALSVMRCLKRGEFLGLLADRDFSDRDDRVPFFGHPARIPLGPAVMSFRTGAPVLPTFIVRQVDDTFLLRLHAPLYPEQFDSPEAIREKICRILEKEIGEQPYQWFIFDDFWGNTVEQR